MRLEEIDKWDTFHYKVICDVCELTTMVLTQEDSFPEYYTKIYVMCTCGNYLEFNLPVN